ncbi:MAG: guanylate kinase [Clostridia bacterium]|nr:guanylate kinase [Clostridia bacterium]
MGQAKGILVVLSGPSGAGKGAVRNRLLQRRPDVRYGVSATTRPRRAYERDGIDYRFMSREAFEASLASGEFVEWAEVYGNLYGTPREPMESWLRSGIDVVVEKDVQGAAALRRVYPDAVYVFVVPPSLETLRHRMASRGTETEAQRAVRLASAPEELSQIDGFDYVLVNDDLDEAARKLEAILTAESCRVSRRRCVVQELLTEARR